MEKIITIIITIAIIIGIISILIPIAIIVTIINNQKETNYLLKKLIYLKEKEQPKENFIKENEEL